MKHIYHTLFKRFVGACVFESCGMHGLLHVLAVNARGTVWETVC